MAAVWAPRVVLDHVSMELLVKIFEYLDDIQTLLMVVPRVCVRWKQCVRFMTVPRLDLASPCAVIVVTARRSVTSSSGTRASGACVRQLVR